MPDAQRTKPAAPKAEAARPQTTEPPAAEPAAAAVNWSSWSNLWQVPAILISLVLIGLGLYVATRSEPHNDFDGALDQVEALLAEGRLDVVETQLRDVIEPHLELANAAQKARFHAAAADWIYLSQQHVDAYHPANDHRIVEQYQLAIDSGAALSPTQLDRLAQTQISLGELDGARARLADLELLASGPGQWREEARLHRNQVLRSLVTRTLKESNLSYDDMSRILSEFRADQMLSPADEAWAIARQTELRLEAGLPQQAVDRLLIDMRRLEARLGSGDRMGFGELYMLLGRGYFNLGEFNDAQFHLRRALETFDGPDPVRGDAMILLAQMAQSDGRLDEAFTNFDLVVRDYTNTRSHLAGLLGRAEVASLMGDHKHSIEDYKAVRDELVSGGPRRDVTPQLVAQSLANRHDAALATGALDLALQYVLLAEEMFPKGEVSTDILLRIASTSRQLADNLIAEAMRGAAGDAAPQLDRLDVAVRSEANVHYKRAADYYVRHARAVAGSPTDDQTWADSLWLAADSYDVAGWHDLGATHFAEYLAGRSSTDPRRAEAIFRLAQAHHAEFGYDAAVRYYEEVIDEYPRSTFAASSHVPLAQCYLATGHRPLAEDQLTAVLAGDRFVDPVAQDYRDALIVMGGMLYESGEYVRAIESLNAAVERYPLDSRRDEVLFRLADSHRGYAATLKDQASQIALARAEQDRLNAQRVQELHTAMDLFTRVINAFERREGTAARRLDKLQEDCLRYSYLYRAGCAFDLGFYDQAIELYDEAARKYANHHSSMTALVQIVNCYGAMGDQTRARAAHARALLRLQDLPADAFDAPDSPLDRQAWEAWLRSIPLGEHMTANAVGAG